MTFPDALRHWRQTRRLSQLDLALEAEVSARHISFLETGRARPSAAMVDRLGAALDLPLAARNRLRTHAGFAVRYGHHAWNDREMAPVQDAIAHMLAAHAPYPALVLDRDWRMVRMNGPAQHLYGLLGAREGDSLLDLLLSEAMPRVVTNWPEVAFHLVRRMRTESAAQGGLASLDRAAAALARVSDSAGMGSAVVVPIRLQTDAIALSLFATIAQFGTPEDITLDALKIELYFPADDASKAGLEDMAATAG